MSFISLYRLYLYIVYFFISLSLYFLYLYIIYIFIPFISLYRLYLYIVYIFIFLFLYRLYLYVVYIFISLSLYLEMYSETSRASKMDLFAEIASRFYPLNIFASSSILDVLITPLVSTCNFIRNCKVISTDKIFVGE